MCGIFGQYSPNPKIDKKRYQARLQAAQKALQHRGPDDQGLLTEKAAKGTLSLGHTRLSIIDLSSAGHQPMNSADGRWSIVFNGEIHNYCELRMELNTLGHIFETETDTEPQSETESET